MLGRPAIRGEGSCLRQWPNAIGLAPSTAAESGLGKAMCLPHSLISCSIACPLSGAVDEVDVVECE